MRDYITRQEANKMVEKAIDRHNRNASLISMAIGFTLLFFYADGLLRVVEKLS